MLSKLNLISSNLLRSVMEGAAVLDDVMRHGRLLVQVHLGADHVLTLSFRQMSLLHESLKLKILLASDHDDLVHVGDHHPGLEQEGQVHDDVLVPGGGALDSLPPHLLVNLRMGDAIQFVPLGLVLCKNKSNLTFIHIDFLFLHKFLMLKYIQEQANLENNVPESSPVQFPVIVKNSQPKFVPEMCKISSTFALFIPLT